MSKPTRTIEMPPLDYQFPPELNPETTPVQAQQAQPAAPIEKTEQQLEQERPQYQDTQYQDTQYQDTQYQDTQYQEPVQQQEPQYQDTVIEDKQELAFQQKNFKAMREESRRLQKERDLFEYQLEQMKLQEQERNKPAVQKDPEIDFDFDMDDDSLVEAKQLKKYAQSNKQMYQELQQMKQTTRQAQIEAQVRTKFPDWEKVVSTENIAKFASIEPELAESLRQTKDPYLQLVSAYKLIKNSSVYSEPIEVSSANDDRRRIEQNNARPRPSASIAPSSSSKPLSAANDYAIGRVDRNQLAKENKIMNDIIRGAR
jgi:hypothetical protein